MAAFGGQKKEKVKSISPEAVSIDWKFQQDSKLEIENLLDAAVAVF